MNILILIGVLIVLLALSVVMRHALMILPFVLTAYFLYWKSGEDE